MESKLLDLNWGEAAKLAKDHNKWRDLFLPYASLGAKDNDDDICTSTHYLKHTFSQESLVPLATSVIFL